MKIQTTVFVLLIALMVANPVVAEEASPPKPEAKYVPDQPVVAKTKVQGWDGKLSVGASAAMSQASNVVGVTDGVSLTFGGQLKSGMDFLRRGHEWRNTLDYALLYTKAPNIDDFAKSADELALESIYLYHLSKVPWLGPFARFKISFPFFPGHDVRSGTTTYVNAADPTDTVDATSLRLSDPFLPLRLRQSAGIFAKPLDRSDIGVEIKAGFDALQTFADGQRAIEDVDTTDQVEFTLLSNVIQGGPSIGVLATGALVENRVLYAGLAEAMFPVLNNNGDDRGIGDLINLNFQIDLSFKLVSWASLDYQFKALREPQLVDKFQIQNNILLTFSYTFFEPAKPPKSS